MFSKIFPSPKQHLCGVPGSGGGELSTESLSLSRESLASLPLNLDMAQDLPLSMKEKSFPVAYVITAYMDPRNLDPGSVRVKLTVILVIIELQLVTAFRPHNSYCVHVDPSSDSMFR